MQLPAIEIDHGRSGPRLLVTGGVHGDEFEPPVAIRRLSERAELADLRGRLTLVPVVNESAFARGQRAGADGLDLARTCPGRTEGTVTEQAAYQLSQLIRSADNYIDLHTGGTVMSVWPLAGYTLHPAAEVLAQQRAMARAFNLPVMWGTDHRLQGRSLSVARDANVPAIYAEYEGGGRFSARGVTAYVEGCLNVMAHLGMIERPLPVSNVQFFVEDPRPQSGHMQRCYPAPVEGCFVPAVELGQAIRTGQTLGHVVSPICGDEQCIAAAETGRVLVLRTFPAVKRGDSLAVILAGG